jgi:hypothetical protein
LRAPDSPRWSFSGMLVLFREPLNLHSEDEWLPPGPFAAPVCSKEFKGF